MHEEQFYFCTTVFWVQYIFNCEKGKKLNSKYICVCVCVCVWMNEQGQTFYSKYCQCVYFCTIYTKTERVKTHFINIFLEQLTGLYAHTYMHTEIMPVTIAYQTLNARACMQKIFENSDTKYRYTSLLLLFDVFHRFHSGMKFWFPWKFQILNDAKRLMNLFDIRIHKSDNSNWQY